GCASSTDIPAPVVLTMTTPDGAKTLNAAPGAAVPLRVSVRDGTGAAVTTPGPIAFLSRNTNIASVDSTGLIRAGIVGTTYVVGSLGTGRANTVRDSVGVIVAAPL